MTREIIISNKPLTAIVDNDDFSFLNRFTWMLNNHGYAISRETLSNGKQTTLYMHRLVMNNPKEKIVDHINGDKLDNRKANLRLATRAENNRNARKRKVGTSKYKGVSLYKGRKPPQSSKWKAQIQYNKKKIAIGYFDSEIEAAKAYDSRAKELFGEFAVLNFKKEEKHMPGPIRTHPFLKTFDELQRSINRMNTYLDMYYEIIPDDEKESIQIMVEKMQWAIKQIPDKYRVSRWKQFNK